MISLKDGVESIQKIPLSFLIAVIVVLTIILFVPTGIADRLAVSSFRDRFNIFLGPALLLSTGIVIARVWILSESAYKSKKKKQAWKNEHIKHLERLTFDEKACLARFVIDKKNTVHAKVDDGIMGGLFAKTIVFRSANTGTLIEGFPYNLQPWAREHLEKNLNMLDGYENGNFSDPRDGRRRWGSVL